jgi:isoleucyl-tRNA synthetase
MAVYPRSQDAPDGVPAQPSFPALEEDVLKHWQASDTFRASIAQRADAPEFVFYDGPPFANGLPHYGHLLTGYVKDVVPRYKTMRGFKVDRRFGWDCHGLPAEVEAERLLGISGKADIVAMGIDKFNDACRESVLRYTQDWQDYVNRQARWVDFGNDYKTLNPEYMESVMWAFKRLYDKGLVYQGFKVLPYCWRCETPLSNHELRMDDDVYQQRQDPSVTVRFKLETGEWLLAWTTTPWTLPSNLAIAVGADIRYAVVERDYERYILAEERLDYYNNELGDAVRVATLTGAELAGRRYEPLFPYLADTPNAFRVILALDVTTEDGTGVVHMAPAYGESDADACNAAGIPTVLTVDDQARFTSLVPDFEGQHVFDANKPIIERLRESGALIRVDQYTHSYPHCWRCRNPLIYKAVSSWFVEVTRFRDRMVELNEQITWVPEHVKDGQFGKWLSNARDWSISRNRFWGSPIPVWMSDDPAYPRVDVYGSLDELERDFGVRPTDLHRPFIDSLTRPNPDDPTGVSSMRRVPEVLDCWFESGSMPFAQVHYPFENREWFDSHYPGDFIVEYIGQTRGWFYTLHVLATALFDRPSFRNCLSHGIVLGDDGQKMSKSLRNYPDVSAVFDDYGSDAMRWFLMSSPVLRGGNLVVTEQGIRDSVRQAILPLWNSYYFFALYANAESYTARLSTDSKNVLDRYILAKTRTMVAYIGAELDEYNIASACQAVREHLELMTNWYIRRSRSRFWQGDTDALDTLYTVLETTCRAAAPLLPLTVEAVWRGLVGGESVHLTDWPDVSSWPADPSLADAMDLVRSVCSSALSLRKARQLRVRLPLASLTVAHPDALDLGPFTDIIRDELNVKDVLLDTDPATLGTFELAVNPRVLGPRLGGKVQEVIRAVKAGDWTRDADDVVTAAGEELRSGEYELKLAVATGAGAGATAALPGGVGLVALDTALTPDLEAEGTARDVVRLAQQARRDAGLDVSDRIHLVIGADQATADAVAAHADFVKAETLAVSLATETADTLTVTVTKILQINEPRPAPLRANRRRHCFPLKGAQTHMKHIFTAAALISAAAVLAGTGIANAVDAPSFIGPLHHTTTLATTVPGNGDVNPYGVAVVPRTTGDLFAGNVLVSNFNNKANTQGTGTTLVEVTPSGPHWLFARINPHLPGCPGGVGLTTALTVLRSGWVIVGSLPTAGGKISGSGCLIVLDSHGVVQTTWAGGLINGPWDLAAVDEGSNAVLFVTNVLNGTVAAGGKTVFGGTVLRLGVHIPVFGTPFVTSQTIIGSGFPEALNSSALVIGPTGVGFSNSGILYVADTLANRIAAIPAALTRHGSAGRGFTVSAGGHLNGELGLVVAPGGDILTVNGGNGLIVEVTPFGAQVAWRFLDHTGTPPGSGALFGLAVKPGHDAVYYVDDDTNTLNLLT